MKKILCFCLFLGMAQATSLDEKYKNIEVSGEIKLLYDKQKTTNENLKRKPKKSEATINLELK
ncbi:hypothetical protein DMB92_06255 [Campylobacter sp. MIT 99-7217]|uniref:hypothetical protein n=1 Tax=Campylobacter sp. MIT 99-7217 TaxID=535091 RepID=UPI001159403D|nr:hypothetical protein [Campylobacter sp. MIT 99-7217]TQR31290.1 hypothetical protein DMB92_06255 [Campylobacter sp. MIT 99-7217]